jgi:hypothetical protein
MHTFKGTHGTTQTRADSIKAGGFQLANHPQMRGGGVYFWKDGVYAKNLATGWYRFSLENNKYRGDRNTGCFVIGASFSCDDSKEYLRLDDLQEVIASRAKEFSTHLSKKEISRFYDIIISETEKELHTKIKIIETSVGLPARENCFPFYDLNLLGCPRTYIVRDVECIVCNYFEDMAI